jgi:hypothetical protein
MKGSHLFWLSRSKGMTVDIWIRDYSRRKSLAGVNIMEIKWSGEGVIQHTINSSPPFDNILSGHVLFTDIF